MSQGTYTAEISAKYSYHILEAKTVPLFVSYLDSIAEFEEFKNRIPVDLSAMESRFKGMINDMTGFAILVVDEVKGIPVGCLVIDSYVSWWSSESWLSNVIFYVDPEHRKSRIALEMIQMAKNFAKAVGKLIFWEVLSGTDTCWKSYERIFQIYGFKKTGACFIFDPDKMKEAA